MPDEQGRYHFDEMGNENFPEYLGDLVGSLCAPLTPGEAVHFQNRQAQQEYLCRSVTAQYDEGRASRPPHSEVCAL